MPTNGFERYVTPSLIRNVFSGSILEKGTGWCILLSGKVVTVNGKMFFASRQQAVKAFYNSFHWRAGREMYQAANPQNERWWNWWSSPNRTACWKTFKSVLERDYGLKIVRV